MRSLAKKTFIFLFIIGVWKLITIFKIWPSYVFPSPEGVFLYLEHVSINGELIKSTLSSLKRLVIGYSISIIVGVVVGLLFSEFKYLKKYFGPYLLGLQTLPSICWLPISLLWFGLNDNAIIFVIIMGSTFSMTQATMAGFESVPPILKNAGLTLGASRYSLYWKVIIPSAVPSLLEGMRQSWSFAWRSLMGGELLFVTPGIGHMLNMGRELSDINQVVAVMIVIIIVGVILDYLFFEIAQKRALKIRGLGSE